MDYSSLFGPVRDQVQTALHIIVPMVLAVFALWLGVHVAQALFRGMAR